MLGEQVSRQAGKALVADVCARAKSNGCNLLEQPRDKLAAYITVGLLALLPDLHCSAWLEPCL